jgi:tetratricopeptide (TPR) repeat protein
MSNKRHFFYCLLLGYLLISCQADFLDKKPDKALVVPVKLTDFQALLDNVDGGLMNSPGLNVIAGDEFYTTAENIPIFEPIERGAYLWAEDVYQGGTVSDWNTPYRAVFVCNVVLDGIEKIKPTQSRPEWEQVRGSALFYRAVSHYNLAQQFAAHFDTRTARQTEGIPIRLTSDVNEIAGRGTLWDTYQQIIGDLQQASELLPEKVVYKNRPSRPAALAMLARVHLIMEDYLNAEKYASQCLNLVSFLLDFNSIDISSPRPFPSSPSQVNEEVLYFSTLVGYLFFYAPFSKVDTVLYDSYADNDLRKVCYFSTLEDGSTGFKGSYGGDYGFFSGLATDEVYLTRAESLARQGKTIEAMSDLNRLLQKRWKRDSYLPLEATNPNQALKLILAERRKELVARGVRWTDLRRLNKDIEFQTTLRRELNQVEYVLLPESKRYVFPIPANETGISGINQNPR